MQTNEAVLLDQAAAQEIIARPHVGETKTQFTRQEAMEELTRMLNASRASRKFAYTMWGEDSAHEIWDKEISLFEYLLAELSNVEVADSAN